MDKNRLQPGDWAMIKDFPMKFLPEKFTEHHWVRSLCEFEPIELTKEILIKNGFKPNDNNELELKFPTTFVFRSYVTAFYMDEKNMFIFDIHKVCDDYSSTTVHKVIGYVHELQQALRVCEFYEFADNFII